jgi:hypothetical protein
VLNLSKSGHINVKEFVVGMLKIYLSTIETKQQLVFNM